MFGTRHRIILACALALAAALVVSGSALADANMGLGGAPVFKLDFYILDPVWLVVDFLLSFVR